MMGKRGSRRQGAREEASAYLAANTHILEPVLLKAINNTVTGKKQGGK